MVNGLSICQTRLVYMKYVQTDAPIIILSSFKRSAVFSSSSARIISRIEGKQVLKICVSILQHNIYNRSTPSLDPLTIPKTFLTWDLSKNIKWSGWCTLIKHIPNLKQSKHISPAPVRGYRLRVCADVREIVKRSRSARAYLEYYVA